MLNASTQALKPIPPVGVIGQALAQTQTGRGAEGIYLCLCNAISDTQIAQAFRGGARRPRDVYASCGCRAQCGRCAADILSVMRGLSAAAHAPLSNTNR
ncbi:MAG: bacterioferritin-associated ferredoxin [Acetobacteraceae bacterium]|jgi:bacterioferritin-associated ferredoxin